MTPTKIAVYRVEVYSSNTVISYTLLMLLMTNGGKQENLCQKERKIFWVLYLVKTGNDFYVMITV